jgi:hypothetical protein
MEHRAPERGAARLVAAVSVDVTQLHRPEAPAQARVDLVAVAEPVDQSRCDGLLRRQRRALDDLPDLRRLEAPGGGHVRDDRLRGRLSKPTRHLATGVGHAGAEEGVRCGLVLVALGELRLDAEAVERPADEERVCDDPGEAEVARRLEPDLLERRGEVVADVRRAHLAEALGPGDGRFPGRAEPPDGVAQLARMGEADRALSDMGDESDDMRVARRAREPVDQPADDRDLPPTHAQRRGGRRLENATREIELEEQGVGATAGHRCSGYENDHPPPSR